MNLQNITVKIKNEGIQTILASDSILTACYRVNNGTVITQIVNTDIPAQGFADFTFSTQANFPSATKDETYIINAWVNLTTDPLKINDSLSKTIISGYKPQPPAANNIDADYAASATLTATLLSSESVTDWYNNLTDSAAFYTGNSYSTPVLFDTVTYYLSGREKKPSIIKITELQINKGGTGTTASFPSWATGADLIEITNLGGTSANLSGYVFKTYGTGSRSYTFPSLLVESGQVVILCIGAGTDNLANRYLNTGGTSDAIASSSLSGFALFKPDNTIADALAINGYTFTTDVTSADWTGNIYNVSGFAGVTRTVSDNNSASDWIVANASNIQTIGSMNPLLTTPSLFYTCPSNRVAVKAMISNFPDTDTGILKINLPSDTLNSKTNIPIKVRLKNYGLDTLQTATIEWSLNGIIQTQFIWNGNIKHGDSTEFIISDTAFNNAGIFALKAWIKNANGINDNYKINDTANCNIFVRLAGSFTLGSGGDFASFTHAVNVLNTYGIGDNVTFNVLSGTYEESLVFQNIKGTSASKRILFISDLSDSTSVVLHYTTSASVSCLIKFISSSYISFSKMTLSVEGGNTYGRIIELTSASGNIDISDCVLNGVSSSGSGNNFALIYSNEGNISNNNFCRNRFEKGNCSIYLSGISGNNCSSNTIKDNVLNDYDYYGIYLYYQDSCIISGNTLRNSASSVNLYAIYTNNINNFSILKNKIKCTASAVTYGIYMSNANTISGNGIIGNNFISQAVGSGTVNLLYNASAKNISYLFNTFCISKGSLSSNVFYNTGNNSGNKFFNNIFANLNGGYAYYASSVSGIDSSNFNCLYTTGSNLAYWNGARANLTALKSASGKEANSLSVNPAFIDSTSDLHITNIILMNKGIKTTEITDDIDNQTREILPTIGADEINRYKFLKIKCYLEGLFNGINMNPVYNENGVKWVQNIADKIIIELHNSQQPYITEKTLEDRDLNVNTECNIEIPALYSDSYYIVIKHRNHLETWSSYPVSFAGDTIDYNFTNSASMAYGNNMKELAPGVFGIFVGDINQDGLVDGSDMSETETDNNNFTTGYFATDVNGDGLVDGSDMSIVETNNNNFVGVIQP